MKCNAIAAAMLALFLAGTAAAQDATPAAFVGKWRAEWTTRDGKATQADLDIPASGQGSWQTYGRASRTNSCIGKAAPVYVQSTSAEVLELAIKMSETIAGCEDRALTLRASPGGAPTGQWRSGGAVTLSPR